ncbi:MAG: hypothetical protein J6C92_14840 [Bacteroidaceae bacterium]|nr:hypothetical protein [Bacteroidaceae bacterium]
MIKEKTVYCSTKTGKAYDSLVDAILEDTASDSNADVVEELLQKFKSTKDEFYSELSSAKVAYEKGLAEKIAEIHSKYDDTLDQLAEQLSKHGVNLSDDSQNDGGKAPKRHPRRHVKVVKVRTIGNSNNFPTRCFR